MVFLADLAFIFYSGISLITTSRFQMYTSCKIETIEIPASLFFHDIGHNLAHILPLKPHPLYFYLNDF